MNIDALIDVLGYGKSPHFLPVDRLARATEHVHIFRRAVRTCNLHGVYVLRKSEKASYETSTPVVYLASADSRHDADLIHKRVWNQNVVPFLIIRTPDGVRLYSGFWYQRASRTRANNEGEQVGVLDASIRFNEVVTRLRGFHAHEIDDGTLWREWGEKVAPSKRVDWRLLDNLKQLADWLRARDLTTQVAHALIGKFVYLRYLRDRDVLSERKLAEWGIAHNDVFGRNATLSSVRELVDRVDSWLNGSIFPLPFSGRGAPTDEHLQKVTGVFLGDETGGQQHLDFSAYDFSHIPIETLSIIYEQFLAIEGKHRATGAYYTPIPLVNFMLAELDDSKPLHSGMRVLDPSCGSGAFLVQCYRRLIEYQIRERRGGRLRPSELRELLVRHIFGLDRDPDACRVAELSLVLTMLDYIDPPDLQSTPTFKLPDLHNRNIFEADFFDPASVWRRDRGEIVYDWIVGNPPWIRLPANAPSLTDRPAYEWITNHAKSQPVIDHEIAEAFAWKAVTHLAPEGVIGLLLPAMTLFREATAFRAQFFRQMNVTAVANFANLREVLFAGRARMPSAAIFYTPRIGHESPENDVEMPVLVYSPMVANQAANQPPRPGTRMDTWTITLDHSEVRALRRRTLQSGGNLPWKLAMWGSVRDERLLNSLAKRFPILGTFVKNRKWAVSQGLELRKKGNEPTDPVPEVIGKYELDVEKLRRLRRIHEFPPSALVKVDTNRAHARTGRRGPLAVCYGPHVVVSAARAFAVFHDDFLVVPHPQIGIVGPKEDVDRLRALALFLNTDFAAYHQFLTSPQEGVHDGRGTLRALRKLPVPLNDIEPEMLRHLHELHEALKGVAQRSKSGSPTLSLTTQGGDDGPVGVIERELNHAFDKIMRLEPTEQCLIQDLVHVRMHLRDGQFGAAAVRAPSPAELRIYADMLCKELDAFLDETLGLSHRVTVIFDRYSGMVQIESGPRCGAHEAVHVLSAEVETAREFHQIRSNLERKAGQWIYFDRNLLLQVESRSFFFKPLQLLWWTRTQALLDADEVIAESLAPEGVS